MKHLIQKIVTNSERMCSFFFPSGQKIFKPIHEETTREVNWEEMLYRNPKKQKQKERRQLIFKT